ncbi:MAG: response regulator [Candidatus Latescibacterota bacterium]|nr:response regulator [Candidatus Latescibacterota bacterium]
MAPSDPLVLIADDNAPLRKLGRCLLEKGGYTVETAQDGIETLDRIKQGGITLVLLDIWISDKTGLDVLDNLRGVKAPPRVIVLTSDTTSAALLWAIHGRAHTYLNKPIESNALLSAVKSSLSLSPRLPIEIISSLPNWVELGQTSTKRPAPRWTRKLTHLVPDA